MTPPLVHIGYHKTGTQWIRHRFFGDSATGYRWLGKQPVDHPVKQLVRVRPLDFDAGAIRGAFEPLLAAAEAEGLLPVVSFPRLSGHPYSGGFDSKEIADRLKQVFPDARILIIIREQASIITSSYKQYVEAGGTCKPRQYLDPPKQEWRVPHFDLGHFEYDRLIRYYHSLYGPEAVLALPYEQFVRDGPAFIRSIGEFAGRPVPEEAIARMPFSRWNPAKSALAIAASRPLNRFGPRTDLNPAPLVESMAVYRLAKRLRKANLRKQRLTRTLAANSEERLRQVVRDVIGDRYRESNRATAELIGVDLAEYGWKL